MKPKVLTIDCETSGLPPKKFNYKEDFLVAPRIVSIGWKINENPSVAYIINQEGFKIPDEAIAIHGITNELAEISVLKLEDVLRMLLKEGLNSDIVVGHGLYFDTSIIKANILKLKDEKLYNHFTELLHKDKRVDTMMKTIKFCGKWPKLSELYLKLFDETFNAHDNKSDVEATYRCYNELLKRGVL